MQLINAEARPLGSFTPVRVSYREEGRTVPSHLGRRAQGSDWSAATAHTVLVTRRGQPEAAPRCVQVQVRKRSVFSRQYLRRLTRNERVYSVNGAAANSGAYCNGIIRHVLRVVTLYVIV